MTVVINGTTGVTSVNGTAGAPSVTGTDTDTGIVYGTNTLSLATGGTAALNIDSSQNVGIGTSSPQQKLDVTLSSSTAYSSGVTGNGLRVYNSSATTGQYVGITLIGEPTSGNGGVATIMGTTTGSGNMDLVFSTRGSSTLAERMRIDSSGNVGIATNSPDSAYKVTIQRTAGGSGNILLQGDDVTVGLPSIVYKNTNGGATAYLGFNGENVTAKGIAFPATQVASSNANTLDDYEEGTWSPSISFASAQTGSFTYGRNTGYYVKVGRLVHVQGWLTWSAKPSGGSTLVFDLPFANLSNDDYRGGLNVTYSDSNFTGTTVYNWALRTEQGSTRVTFNYSTAADGNLNAGVNATNLASTGGFMFSGTFVAA